MLLGLEMLWKNAALEIECRYLVYPQCERYLAAVVEVMFDGAPDDPLTCESVRLLVLHLRENVLQVGRGPASKRHLNHLPGGLQPTY